METVMKVWSCYSEPNASFQTCRLVLRYGRITESSALSISRRPTARTGLTYRPTLAAMLKDNRCRLLSQIFALSGQLISKDDEDTRFLLAIEIKR